MPLGVKLQGLREVIDFSASKAMKIHHLPGHKPLLGQFDYLFNYYNQPLAA
jgi:hypothetical protein